MSLKIPTFKSKEELIDFLIENKKTLIAQKMNAIKFADPIASCDLFVVDKEETTKAINTEELQKKDEITVKVVINTTNVMDSHNDVHLKGIWKKSLKENKRIMHIQEHKSDTFSAIIASGDDLKAYTKTMTWKELGYDMQGTTEALMFESKIKKERNPYMFDQYAKGYVNNHSVGMRYMKVDLAVNDDRYEEEYKIWEKYIGEVANRQDAEENGYFYAVQEAKAIEGSAVPVGSNQLTPTLSIKNEPLEDTQKNDEAAKALQQKKDYFINLLKH